MDESLTKLRPDRDLQCYFFQPTAVAALSGTGATGFTLSGCWRQQFDWAVVEWNRDNVFEHPALRNLPDGDLSGLKLSYQETRLGCIPLDSELYATVDWPSLRMWVVNSDGTETVYFVPLAKHATALNATTKAQCSLILEGSITASDYIELSWPQSDGDGGASTRHYNYQVQAGDTLATAVAALAGIISANSAAGLVTAEANGATITLTYAGMPGSNGNRIGVYGTVHANQGIPTEQWSPNAALFSGGVSPTSWEIALDFSSLTGSVGIPGGTLVPVPTTSVRKMRWTWAADYTVPVGNFQRTEFSVLVSNWSVTGTGLNYSVAGPGSRRIEDDGAVTYGGAWTYTKGNYSGGSVHSATVPGATVTCSYTHGLAHTLYLGVQCTDGCAEASVQVDSGTAVTVATELAGENVAMRVPVGNLAAGAHTVIVTHAGLTGQSLWFDFLELAVPTTILPTFAATPKTTLATDWDTVAAQWGLPAERVAGLISRLGFRGTANHYAGALWWYELTNPALVFASAIVTVSGTPAFGNSVTLQVGMTQIEHVCLIGDTAETVAMALALIINGGSTGVWASASGTALTITSRTPGSAGNGTNVQILPGQSSLTGTVSGGGALAGGADGAWLTDLSAMPRINRAARDWHTSFFSALAGYGIAGACAFSMELGNGDASLAAGIAQRYPNGAPCMVNTPALQTNFGPQATAYWKQAYLDMAGLMSTAGICVYLQFGEIQWWYFCPPTNPAGGNWNPLTNGGMPFYDAYTTSAFQAQYSTAMHVFTDPTNDPSAYPNESAFLPGLVGAFTTTIANAVKGIYSAAKFEVLYPSDVNDALLTKVINYPSADWTPANLSSLKTENFTYTGNRNLDKACQSVLLPSLLGFPASQASHLVGIGDYTTPWLKEWSAAIAAGVETVVLFAIDQFCLIGYSLPLNLEDSRSGYLGS